MTLGLGLASSRLRLEADKKIVVFETTDSIELIETWSMAIVGYGISTFDLNMLVNGFFVCKLYSKEDLQWVLEWSSSTSLESTFYCKVIDKTLKFYRGRKERKGNDNDRFEGIGLLNRFEGIGPP
ncbi:hypothetical protein C4D60_Mb06t22700 [Musa balbisiana]|uniref:Uncharacterized protein n=1 Tax=Musa balbisiana TaxID=52838 RepID=A0A4V4H435_MUSBA|nr:hypothetical protein C4D60_Mb06t22700 [Musa balbisiana]